MRGVVYVAYGQKARFEALASLTSLQRYNRLPVSVISDRALGGAAVIQHPDADPGGRLAKLSLCELSPYEQTLYLDADTRVHGDLSGGFELIEAGWDLALTISTRQGSDVLGNCDEADRRYTFEALGTDEPLGLQAGVMFLHRDRCRDLFAAWREEWQRFRRQDQAALLRALARVPVRLWLLGRTWNGGKGDLVEHRFGRARR